VSDASDWPDADLVKWRDYLVGDEDDDSVKALIDEVLRLRAALKENHPIRLPARDVDAYTCRGAIHSLAYYDGAILDAQTCGLSHDRGSVVEISADTRAAETDGSMVYLRLSRDDLAALMRMLDEPTSAGSGNRHCGQHPYAHDRADCEQCFPTETT
jgi:hypothetical protein